MTTTEELQAEWKHLYHDHLPSLARAKDSVQKKWPVQLDHCFARIVLDNAVGKDQPWTKVIKSPAIKNMTQSQLEQAIDLAQRLATGEADLVELDERSLALRGKKSKVKPKQDSSPSKKRPAEDDQPELKHTDTDKSSTNPPPNKRSKPSPSISTYFQSATTTTSPTPPSQPDLHPTLQKIATSTLTAFRKRTLTALTHVPRGEWTTYAALAAHLSRQTPSQPTCARAVGSAMRNNPFAPEVPCHRVLASGGKLGGFGGGWGEDGVHAEEKRALLKGEGVVFDSRGRAKGREWCGWEEEAEVKEEDGLDG